MIDTVDDATCANDIDVSISALSDLMHSICDPLFTQTKQAKSPNNNKEKPERYTFDNNCSEKREKFYQNLNTFRKNKNDENRNQSRTNGPINAHLTIAQVMPKYNHNNEKQEALL